MSTEERSHFGVPLERFDRPLFNNSRLEVCPPSSNHSLASSKITTSSLTSSKLKRQGSKLMSVIRSWARNSVSSASEPGKIAVGLSVGQSGNKQEGHTTVHRTKILSGPSLISLSFDNGVLEITPEATPDASPSTTSNSIETSHEKSSGKFSMLKFGGSTGKTSLDSKFSLKSKIASHHSSENHKKSSNENLPLTPIAEVDAPPEPVPTIVTVEKAAATKMFFETHYNNLISEKLTPRSLRRRQVECALRDDTLLTPGQKDEIHRFWAKQETDHLRETRNIKVRGPNALTRGRDFASSKYEVVKVLGKGSFGVVRLVREKVEPGSEKKEIYAMKVIRKSDMLRNSQEGHLRAERDFLVAAEGSRWVVPLIASFQDLNHLYLVMDYMPGGDFLGLLIRDNVLNEQVAKWYTAEMILCIEEAHALHWIHRDIKPDNFLISASGHLKISDFGLAFDGHWSHDQDYYNNHRYSLLMKLGIQVEGDTIDRKEGRSIAAVMKTANNLRGVKDRHECKSIDFSETKGVLNWRNRNGNRTLARSVVGTSQYMAPEVVRGELYDGRCDWWSLAVILYECLYGHTPFLAEEGGRQQTKINILNHKSTFAFPHKPIVGKKCQDLIQNILQEKENRLCSKRYRFRDGLPSGSHQNQDYTGRYVYANDAEDIKSHKWFKDIPWDRLHTMTPPFVPNIKSTDDTHYFDEEDPISDFSKSIPHPQATPRDISEALRPFHREIRILAAGYIEKPHDSVKMRKIEKEIDAFNLADEQKEYLKGFVKTFGRKEKKRPRDRLLRDKELAPKVMEIRKSGAFLGYTYRRIRMSKGTRNPGSRDECAGGSIRGSVAGRRVYLVGNVGTGSVVGRKNVWHRPQLSIH